MWQQDEPRKPMALVNPVLFWNPRGKVVSVSPDSIARVMNEGWETLTPNELRTYRPGDYVASRDSQSVASKEVVAAHRPEAVPAASVTTVNLAPKKVAPVIKKSGK